MGNGFYKYLLFWIKLAKVNKIKCLPIAVIVRDSWLHRFTL
ncbi:Putative arginyl-tRNA--protein transferase [Moritella viscosa]|uniref:Arginyl-tRNA--protein transferase n=1 Tax=Moritella viscosa TaxID=80854 RepID=A0ABY1HJ37_9GAMM|nr:Putative arginyl-tRNA--protein transferase [Moritella viscosa]SGY92833.1 Putative arginyl-tRNA--protein transferase [Moritella viscosa]SGZ02402.1 Putative arginyl-tRNA--protein transferase [Moritella viscosa]SHO25318.1 Putative arginyl-tRNA--protein transferase [Moritella viscosa]